MPTSSAPPAHPVRVALAFQTVQPHLERITRGILAFACRNGWQVALNPEGALVTLESLQGWPGDGVLAMVETPAQLTLAQQLHVPVVNLSARLADIPLPSVLSDNWAIGKKAAEHLLERGFRRCAYYGLEGVFYSDERLRGFRETVEAAGGRVQPLLTHSNLDGIRPWDWDREALETWLGALGGRVGVLAVHDYRAQLVLETARRLGISVPGDMAVLGVNDDPIACEGSVPALSSVPQDGYELGCTAAALLHEALRKKPPASQRILVPPLRVSARRSTEMFGTEEPRLRQVMETIESRLDRSFGVEELAAQSGVSRRWLEQLFEKHLGCSPHAYIVRRRTRAAETLLETNPEIRSSELARRCGFPSTRSLNAALGASLREDRPSRPD